MIYNKKTLLILDPFTHVTNINEPYASVNILVDSSFETILDLTETDLAKITDSEILEIIYYHYYDDEGNICLDESKYIECKGKKLKEDLAFYRWSICYDKVDNLPQISICLNTQISTTSYARDRLDVSANAVFRKGFEEGDTFRFKGVDGVFTDKLKSDLVEWPTMLVETEQQFFMAEELVQILIDIIDTVDEIDSFNVVNELDNIVKPILLADTTRFAIPIKYNKD